MLGLIITLIVLVVIGVGVGLYVTNLYNSLVRLKNRYENAFSQIEVQLKRRYDLIPNLVETAKGYLKHEQETLENVTQARNQAAGQLQKAAQTPGDPDAMQGLAGA